MYFFVFTRIVKGARKQKVAHGELLFIIDDLENNLFPNDKKKLFIKARGLLACFRNDTNHGLKNIAEMDNKSN
jgi:hypothetical protein